VQTDPHDADVVVIGAGPTGTTAAGLLVRRGLRVLLLDRHAAAYALPRAVHFDDEVLRVLTGMGLGERVRAISEPALGMRLVDGDQRLLLELPRDPSGGPDGLPGANMFDQPDLEALLRNDFERWPTGGLRTGTEVVSTRQVGPERVVVDLADGTSLTARAVLACDGAGSPTRERLGIGMQRLGPSSTWLVVDVLTVRELDRWRGVHQVCDRHRPATFMRVGPLRYRWEFAVRDGETQQQLTAPDVLRALLQPWTGDLGPGEWSVVRATTYTYGAQVARRWRSGRVLLLGDAAHQTPPFLGQGMCAGIRDAANLGWKLAAVLRGAAGDELLDTYEQERRPHATHVIRVAVGLGLVMGARGAATSTVRSALLRGVARVPSLPERMTEHAWPALTTGPLVRRPNRRLGGRSAVGRLVPTPQVVTVEGRRRLDQVLGPGFAVLALGATDLPHVPAGQLPDVVGLRVVDRPPREPDEVQDVDGVLQQWFRDHRATLVTVRPDRVVACEGVLPALR
jgi:3-(3-hydroxy-phenyl)propionate hydroxylase